MEKQWRIWIDTGGTFTDCIAFDPWQQIHRIKVLSSGVLRARLSEKIDGRSYRITHNWPVQKDIFKGYSIRTTLQKNWTNTIESVDFINNTLTFSQEVESLSLPVDFEITAHEEAPILATRLLTGTSLDRSLPPLQMRLGSTKGTNALLEKKGAGIALICNRGFADLTYIGTQQRPYLFQLDIPEPNILFDQVHELNARLDAQGRVLKEIDLLELQEIIEVIKRSGISSVAVALLHSYRNPIQENQVAAALEASGIEYYSLSHQLSPAIKILPRTQTTLVNAYLSPILNQYLTSIERTVTQGSAAGHLLVMSSAGGLISAAQYEPKDSLLSGPAGGVVGAAGIARLLGFSRILTLDMGGTSTDTARYDGAYDYDFMTSVGDYELLSPSLSIETVAAGGGSICYFDGDRLRVGPESAGASPGPACYGAGGPLAVTDINLLLGKLDPIQMGIPVHLEQALDALKQLRLALEEATGNTFSNQELLKGFETIANEKMAEAIRRISIAKGFDPSAYPLLAFGGAGGLHACKIAELLDIQTIILPFDAGLLSAYGMGQAQIERFSSLQVLQLLEDCRNRIAEYIEQLSHSAGMKLQQEGIPNQQIEIREVLLSLRFKGQESTITIPYTTTAVIEPDFKNQYIELFGHFPEDRPIELESIKVIAAAGSNALSAATSYSKKAVDPHHWFTTPLGEHQHPVYYWEQLEAGATFSGPALLLSQTASAFIENGWTVEIAAERNALIRKDPTEHSLQAAELKEAIELELFTNRFMAIAREMGAQLQRTAFSVNVKERLDFSCAILDKEARLLVNAPHIPVHLGSLGICARLILEQFSIEPGDVIITNHPKYGGSHLPDVTLFSGVYTEQEELIGYVINRAHHAEIGGKRPGSMPPDAQNLSEEGVCFIPTYLVRKGVPQWETIEQLLRSGPYPSRAPEENLADINAALAALRTGASALRGLVDQHQLDKVHYYMQRLHDLAASALEKTFKELNGQSFSAVESLDDGHEIHLAIQVNDQQASLDFSGTSASHPHNLNANISIVYSAVLYVLRLLCGEEIPLNDGLMQRVTIKLPPSSFLHPEFADDPSKCPAVVGGNTEVSQRLVDTLLKAFGLAACSQGTMNNFLFGDATFGYYETIGGGAGAGPGFHGRSAVHQHMTNTRITDPEELELRYPVRLLEFAVRKHSGGAGTWNGGHGIIRKFQFLKPLELTILSQHRLVPPYGMSGGHAGKAGRQYLIDSNQQEQELPGIASIALKAGTVVVIETPGGGGWGRPKQD